MDVFVVDSRNVFRLGPVGRESMAVGMECHDGFGGMSIKNKPWWTVVEVRLHPNCCLYAIYTVLLTYLTKN
jgi:hypothetical protein